ncbi:MAG: DUF61 family protein [Thaumarchaeota archaeon]|nr:DUF61 family protein [Candidatus Calditenuaceae archaeon]MDW8041489.1 DUF61 family protein [Nitrososphaerota archaeon]
MASTSIDDAFIEGHLKRLRDNVPVRKASLEELIDSDNPSVETLGGGRHRFRPEDLRAASKLLTGELRRAPALPITFSSGEDYGKGVVILRNRVEAAVYRALMGLEFVPETPEGYAYTYKPMVAEFVRRYPSLGILSV